jgi:hypothetical protein
MGTTTDLPPISLAATATQVSHTFQAMAGVVVVRIDGQSHPVSDVAAPANAEVAEIMGVALLDFALRRAEVEDPERHARIAQALIILDHKTAVVSSARVN